MFMLSEDGWLTVNTHWEVTECEIKILHLIKGKENLIHNCGYIEYNVLINTVMSWKLLSGLKLAVNTRTVLAIVPPEGCEAILIEILQSKRSAGGPHFTCCFLKSK